MSSFSQSSSCTVPPSSQQSHTATPSHRPPDPVMLKQRTQQLFPTNQAIPFNSQPVHSPTPFSQFPMSQPIMDIGAVTYGRQPIWPIFHPAQRSEERRVGKSVDLG